MTTTTLAISERSYGSINRAAGKGTGDGNPSVINVGFVPKKFRLLNVTDGVLWEKTSEDAAANAIKIDTALAVDTNGYITFTGGGSTDGNGVGTISITADAIPNAKVFTWEAWG